MTNLIMLPDEVWNEVSYWTITPKQERPLDRNFISLNHNDRDSYVLMSEDLMNAGGLTCLEYHIYLHLYPEDNTAEQIFMLDVPFLICGPGGPTPEQEAAEMPEVRLTECAPVDYQDQPKVFEALLSLESKGYINIERKQPD